MSERIDTKAVLANPLWLPEDTSTGIVYRCGYCSTIQSKSIYVKERHTNSCPRPALVQEIADREGDRKKIKALEVIAADKVLLNEQVAVLEDDIEGYEEAIRGLLKRIAVLEARIEALESDKAAMRLEIVTIIGMYGDHMHPRVKQALEAVAVAYPPAALAAEEKRP